MKPLFLLCFLSIFLISCGDAVTDPNLNQIASDPIGTFSKVANSTYYNKVKSSNLSIKINYVDTTNDIIFIERIMKLSQDNNNSEITKLTFRCDTSNCKTDILYNQYWEASITKSQTKVILKKYEIDDKRVSQLKNTENYESRN